MKTILDEYGVPLEQLMPLVELASGYPEAEWWR